MRLMYRCAEGLGADIIDLHACGINYFNLNNYVATDGTHPKESGWNLWQRKSKQSCWLNTNKLIAS